MVLVQHEDGEIMQGEKKKGMRVGKYEVGRTLGEGNFGKVKYAKHVDSGQPFAIKILEKARIVDLKFIAQIKREIGSSKLLKHPNVVRLYELENVLIDTKGNIKITDFGLSALPQQFWDDGLLHTTCGSPNYVAPEILSNRGYDGATSDTWSCGVILYVILTGQLPFDDKNLAILYKKIFKGDVHIPKWLSVGAKNLIKRILDPNPRTRITMAEIKIDEWFKQDYVPANPYEEDLECDHISTDNQVLTVQESTPTGAQRHPESHSLINAFQLIGMSSCLDLSGFFEKEDISERKIRFTSNLLPKQLLDRIENTVTQMGFQVQKRHGRLKVLQEYKGQKCPSTLSVVAEVFEIIPSLYVVELQKSSGDSTVYRQLCNRISSDLGVQRTQEILI
ncbi:PREDICTED: CBL-interacting serine/threonine-protein kinase 1-like [Nicotiana attenuata]|uniref:non-specific serine/threonine protein kinase n=1 Tax=Nicotiana attenuata TaxID=49451 RepID=A0A314KKU4_NICAT|nr:PREDICTED: CBL-interacting serine/threonine-protein kinase 1-like [Nicotiana attenuata]OIT29985.1 cbl-interacting protein kinase 21 [Nicotiana attenuata]